MANNLSVDIPVLCKDVIQIKWEWFSNFVLWKMFLFPCIRQMHLITRHYCDGIIGTMASQITSITIVYSTVYSGADQRKHQSSASRAFVRGFHRSLVNSPNKRPVTLIMFPFDDVIMKFIILQWLPITAALGYNLHALIRCHITLLWHVWRDSSRMIAKWMSCFINIPWT